jgi:apolipoprotein N-acyltransferase
MLDESRRLQVLAAMGVDVYHLRGVADGASTAAPASTALPATSRHAAVDVASVGVVVVCPRGARADPRLARLFAQLPFVLGIGAARLTWVEMSADGALDALPVAPGYLLVGSSAARACAARLSLTRQNQATIAVCAEPQELLAGAQARRVLWQVLKPLARRLRTEAG